MKTISILLAIILVAGTVSFAQKGKDKAKTETKAKKEVVKTSSFKALGNCASCKTRIEKAARTVVGVQKAVWNQKTQTLEISYKESVNPDDVQKAVAAVGHDTEKFKADDKVYEALHQCCKYKR